MAQETYKWLLYISLLNVYTATISMVSQQLKAITMHLKQ